MAGTIKIKKTLRGPPKITSQELNNLRDSQTVAEIVEACQTIMRPDMQTDRRLAERFTNAASAVYSKIEYVYKAIRRGTQTPEMQKIYEILTNGGNSESHAFLKQTPQDMAKQILDNLGVTKNEQPAPLKIYPPKKSPWGREP